MMGTKLNAQVAIKNLQNMPVHAKSLPPTGARGRKIWNWNMIMMIRTGPACNCKARDHTRAGARGPKAA
jgi:hypothetical protein